MVVMVEDLKACSKKEFRSSKGRNNNHHHHQKVSRSSLLEAIAQGGNITSYTAEDGTVRMKILVKKQDLKHIIGAMNINAGSNNCDRPKAASSPASATPTAAIERRLYELKRRKKTSAQAKGNNSSSWRPALQSIPEEH